MIHFKVLCYDVDAVVVVVVIDDDDDERTYMTHMTRH